MSISVPQGSSSWDRFLEYAAFARSKPAFDLEERELPLALAKTVRVAIKLLCAGKPWLPVMIGALSRARQAGYVAEHEARWFESWAGADDGSLASALAAFAEKDPTESIRSLSEAAEAAWAARRIPPSPAAVLLLGSLFSFAFDPLSRPITNPAHFRPLEAMLGRESPRDSIAGEYDGHVDFAHAVQERLAEADIPVRDMLDVQGLVRSGSLHANFWRVGGRMPVEVEWDSRQPYLSVCATYRDEAPYLREWIEFHRLVGVERFFLYNNLSVDHHREVLDPYVKSGVVVAHEWPMAGGQLEAYVDCVERHSDESRWIAFIDLDEFLFSPTGRPLPDVLAGYESYPGVGVNLAIFGHSGHQTKPSGLVTESYVGRLQFQKTIKSVVNPRRVTECSSVHNFRYDLSSAVDENKYPIHGAFTQSSSCARLRINHYFTKSMEEYRRRCERPNAIRGEKRHFAPWLTNPDVTPNDEYDDVILRYIPALRDVLSGHIRQRTGR